MSEDEGSAAAQKDSRPRRRAAHASARLRRVKNGLGNLPQLTHVLVVLTLALAVAVAASAVLWGLFGTPTLEMTGPNAGLELVKVALLITGGIGGTVALTVSYRRQRMGEAAERREAARLFHERFQNASQQLASEHSANRLAGVYALAGLADDWADGRQTCVDVLCAYMRMPYTPPETLQQNEADVAEVNTARQERQVRRTVMDVVGERLRAEPVEGVTWHGCRFDFSGAVVDGGDLSGAQFVAGAVDFTGTEFAEGTVRFRGAQFIGGIVDFSTASFSGSKVDFSNAGFTGGTVNFGGAKFTGGTVNFWRAGFTGGTVNFWRAEFAGGTVDFWDAQFAGGTVDFGGAEFTGGTVNFWRAEFTGGTVDFRGAEFTGGTVNFWRAEFTGGTVNFWRAEFTGGTVNFWRAEFTGGTVEMRRPESFAVPPRFDEFPDGVPDGLMLPEGWTPPRHSLPQTDNEDSTE